MERRHAPVVTAAGRLVRGGERRADHHRVGTAHDGLGDVAAGAHATVGDDVDVHAGLVEMPHAGGPGIGDGRRLRDADAEHPTGGAGVAGSDADQDAGGARAHQVQRSLIARAPADDDRDVELAYEPLEVQRLVGAARRARPTRPCLG